MLWPERPCNVQETSTVTTVSPQCYYNVDGMFIWERSCNVALRKSPVVMIFCQNTEGMLQPERPCNVQETSAVITFSCHAFTTLIERSFVTKKKQTAAVTFLLLNVVRKLREHYGRNLPATF